VSFSAVMSYKCLPIFSPDTENAVSICTAVVTEGWARVSLRWDGAVGPLPAGAFASLPTEILAPVQGSQPVYCSGSVSPSSATLSLFSSTGFPRFSLLAFRWSTAHVKCTNLTHGSPTLHRAAVGVVTPSASAALTSAAHPGGGWRSGTCARAPSTRGSSGVCDVWRWGSESCVPHSSKLSNVISEMSESSSREQRGWVFFLEFF
jgi:hypothetical protein